MDKRKCDVSDAASKKLKSDIDLDVIKYELMPSLQHISITNIIITLWNQADIKYQMFNECKDHEYARSSNKYEIFQKIEDKILDKLSQMTVPNRIRKLLSNIVHPIGTEIFNWIEYHDKYIFYCSGEEYRIAINYINDLIWTSRGRINYKETAKRLLVKTELSDTYKYNIACAYCLTDYIAIIASKDITIDLNSIERQTMVYFWTAHITEDFTELDNAVYFYNTEYNKDYSINEYLFIKLLDHTNNQIAIKYIWNKLSDEEKSRQIIPTIKYTSNSDIKCFLLSQISKEQEKEIFKSDLACKILFDFFDDWLWGQYFLPTIHHVWDIIAGHDYLYILNNVVNKIDKNPEDIECIAVFKELWQRAPKHLKEYFLGNGKIVHTTFFKLLYKTNLNIIHLILFDFKDKRKNRIFLHESIRSCTHFITSNQWDCVEMLMGNTFFSTEDTRCFKETLIKEKGRYIVVYLMQNQDWDKVEQFLKLAFKSNDEIKEFKQSLAHSDICSKILESNVANNKTDFIELENYFQWCASGDEELVVNSKAKIPQLYFDIVITLIEGNKYEILEQVLNWCFIKDLNQISKFKQYFYQNDSICERDELEKLIVNLIKRDDQLQSLKKFFYYWCSTDEEISKFKTCLLYPTEDTFGVCIELLYRGKYKLADEFVNWCFNSSQIRVDNFKNQLMTNEDVLYLSGDDPRTFYETKLIRWFNPTIETIIRFKEHFVNWKWFKDVLPALDNYVQEQQYNQDQAINIDVTNIVQTLLSDVSNQDNVNGNNSKSYRDYY